METKTFTVPNIGCDACVSKIKSEISQLDGVTGVEGDKNTKTVTVQWQQPATWQLIEARLTEIDYPPANA